MNRPAKRVAISVTLLGVSLMAGGCGELKTPTTNAGGVTQTVTLALPQAPNANYAGIYEAQALGYFAAVGIKLQIEVPSGSEGGSASRLGQLNAADFDVTLASAPSVLQLQSQGAAIVAIGAVVQDGLSSARPQYAKQAKAATTTTATTTSRTAAPAKNSKTTTAAHQPGKPKLTGYKIVADNSLLPADLRKRNDLPSYAGLVLVVRIDQLQADSSLLRRFVQAIGRGYSAVRNDPASAAKQIAQAIGDGTSAAEVLAVLKHSLNSFFPAATAEPWGFQSQTQWTALEQWLGQQQLLANVVEPTETFTNELLAGQGS